MTTHRPRSAPKITYSKTLPRYVTELLDYFAPCCRGRRALRAGCGAESTVCSSVRPLQRAAGRTLGPSVRLRLPLRARLSDPRARIYSTSSPVEARRALAMAGVTSSRGTDAQARAVHALQQASSPAPGAACRDHRRPRSKAPKELWDKSSRSNRARASASRSSARRRLCGAGLKIHRTDAAADSC